MTILCRTIAEAEPLTSATHSRIDRAALRGLFEQLVSVDDVNLSTPR